MFIREVTKSAKKKKYIQHKLIESVRTAMGPRQRLVLNLGTLKLSKKKWKELADTIESEIKQQKQLFSPDPEVQKLAKHYANLIIQNKLSKKAEIESDTSKGIIEKQEKEYTSVDLDSLEYSNSKTIGGEHVIKSQINEYKLDTILKKLGFTPSQINYAKILLVSRAVHPSSERETVRWVKENSGIMELLKMENSNAGIYDNALHKTAKLLWKHHDEIERYLAEKAKVIFGLKENIILYDLTNTYFAGIKRASNIAKHGHSKQKRHDRPLVTLALTVDELGFPKGSKIHEGNVGEPGTLENILDDISAKSPLLNQEKTIVIDAGIASKENIEMIKERGFKYVAVSKGRSYPDNFWNDSIKHDLLLSDRRTKLKIQLTKTEDEAFLLCHSEAKEAKEQGIIQRRFTKFEEELTALHEGLKKKRARKKYEYILEKIGRLKEQYGVGSLYYINIEKTKNDKNIDIVTKIKFEKNEKGEAKENTTGQYVIRTNRLDLTDIEISELHRSLTTVEASFKSMKSELGLRPNYHQKDINMESHIFITVLAYHIIAGIMKKLNDQDRYYQWSTIRNMLSSHTRVTSSFVTKDDKIVHIRGNTSPNIKQSDIYRKLKIQQNPIGSKIATIPLSKRKDEEIKS